MTKQTELDQKVMHVRACARTLGTAMWLMNERRHILQPLFRDAAVRDSLQAKLNGRSGARAHNFLVPLLAQDLLRDLARLFLDKDGRTCSLISVFRKVSEPEVQAVLLEHFRTIPDRWDKQNFIAEGFTEEEAAEWLERMLRRDRQEYEQSFKDGLALVAKAMDDLGADPVTEKIRKFRNKNLAHLEMRPLGQDAGPFSVRELGLKYDDLFNFADKYTPAILEIVRIATGGMFAVKSFEEAHRRSGTDMWRTFAGLPEENG